MRYVVFTERYYRRTLSMFVEVFETSMYGDAKRIHVHEEWEPIDNRHVYAANVLRQLEKADNDQKS